MSTVILKPKMPSGKYASHAREILALLLRGGLCDQFTYHQDTGHPPTNFRTRISELGLHDNWKIDRAFHFGIDHNGQPQRCKHYWINRQWLNEQFESDPVFKARCKILMDMGV